MLLFDRDLVEFMSWTHATLHDFQLEIASTTSNKVISLAWNQPLLGSPAFKLSTKLKEVKKKLKDWNRETFGNIHHQLNQVKSQLSAIQNLEPSASNLEVEEIHWKQKSRVQWLTSST